MGDSCTHVVLQAKYNKPLIGSNELDLTWPRSTTIQMFFGNSHAVEMLCGVRAVE
jgi:hypothetical protein